MRFVRLYASPRFRIRPASSCVARVDEYSQVFDESEIEFPGKDTRNGSSISPPRFPRSSEIQVDGRRRSNWNNGLSSSRLSEAAEMGASATRCSVKFNSF